MSTKTVEKVQEKREVPAAGSWPAMFGSLPSIERLRQNIDSLFEGFGKGWPSVWDSDPFKGMPAALKAAPFGVVPKVDVKESDDGYEIAAELPGLEEKDVNISLRGNVLSIAGEKKEEREEKKKDCYWSERSYGSFRRSFQVPDDVDADKVGAKFVKGVLTVTLPKSVDAKKKQRTIEIKTK